MKFPPPRLLVAVVIQLFWVSSFAVGGNNAVATADNDDAGDYAMDRSSSNAIAAATNNEVGSSSYSEVRGIYASAAHGEDIPQLFSSIRQPKVTRVGNSRTKLIGSLSIADSRWCGSKPTYW